MPKLISTLPLRALLFVTALIVALPAATIIVYSGFQARNVAIQDAMLEADHLADEITSLQRSFAMGTEQLISTLAQLPDVQGHDASRVHALLEKIKGLNAQYTNLLVADATGHVWAQATKGPSFNVSDRVYFQRALQSRGLVTGEYIVSRASGRSTFNFAQQFGGVGGKPAGIVIAGIDLDAFRNMVNFDNLPPGANYVLLDHRGIVLTRAFDPDRIAGHAYFPERYRQMVEGPDRGTWTGDSMTGGIRHVSYRKLRLQGDPEPYLYVLAGIPELVGRQAADRALLGSIAMLMPFLLLAALLAWLVGERSIVQPIRLLRLASMKVAAGDLDSRVAGIVRYGELGSLARTFDEMTRQLAERERDKTASDLLYRQLFEVESDALLLMDQARGRILQANTAARRLLGFSQDELLNMDYSVLASNPEGSINALVLGHGQALTETEFCHRDGQPIPCEVAATYFAVGGESVVLIALRDLRARRESEALQASLQDQLLQSQKMESVGRLAGGIAHDFNNLLCVINGHSELIAERPDTPERVRKDLELVRQAGESAAGLTHQLLAFSRKQIQRPRILDLNHLVVDFDRMLRRILGADIKLRTHLEPAPWHVRADPGQIEQVIINLVVNARDAMPQGGSITVETANVVLDETYTRNHKLVEPGEYVLLAISDTGTGMTAETLAHIYEPFFTTKPEGKGTGLGLSTVFGIVVQSGGHVSAYSEPGMGTTFKIYLPREMQDVSPVERQLISQPALAVSATVLVAEDSDGVRNLISETLGARGIHVLEARTGNEAVRLAQSFVKDIHLLVTDVVMPGMGGRELAERLEELRPSMPVLYISGYTEDAILNHGMMDASIDFLEKPFTPRALVEKVAEMLARADRAAAGP